jgi:phosphatidylglycerophosphatase A
MLPWKTDENFREQAKITGGRDKLVEFLATGFFISLIPEKLTRFKKFTGAGFLGTCLAVLFTPFLPEGRIAYGVLLAAFLIFSVKMADKASGIYGTHDDPRIILDEIAGYWTAVAFMERTIFSLTSAFIFFRILDTLKPWPIKWLEKKISGGLGIVADDALAGIEANLLTRLLTLWQF